MSGFNSDVIAEDGTRTIVVHSDEERWAEIKAYRRGMLEESDLWMAPDRYEAMTDDQKTEITNFRQALRDITQHDLEDVAANFPTKPTWMV